MPEIASAASGQQVPGGGNNPGGGTTTITTGDSDTKVPLDVVFSFSTDQLICGQDNNVSLTVTNQGVSGTVIGIGMGFETQYNPEIKAPAEGQEGNWYVTYLDNSGYKGPTWSTDIENAIGPGENSTVLSRINVPCGPTEIKVVGAATSSAKVDPVITQTTFKMVSGISVLPKTGSDSSALYYLILAGLPLIGKLRKFTK